MDEKKRIGSLLTKIREENNLSKSFIASKSRIGLDIIEKIENNDQEYLSKNFLARSFVYNYARHINADLEEVLEVFDSEYGNDRIENVAVIKKFEGKRGFMFSHKFIYVIPISILALIFIMIMPSFKKVNFLDFFNPKEEKTPKREIDLLFDLKEDMYINDKYDYASEFIFGKDNPFNIDLSELEKPLW